MKKYYVRVTDDRHPQYPIYEGRSLKNALTALWSVERTFYALLASGAIVYNLGMGEVEQEWNEGCPPENSTAPDFEKRKGVAS
jgi:hypothetical protein